jgi:hypothetical protein
LRVRTLTENPAMAGGYAPETSAGLCDGAAGDQGDCPVSGEGVKAQPVPQMGCGVGGVGPSAWITRCGPASRCEHTT